MRISIFLLLTATLAFNASAANETNRPIKSLTLPECLERALENNLDIAVERINPRISAWGVVSAQSVYDPLLSFGVDYINSTTPLSPTNTFRTEVLEFNSEPRTVLSGKLPSGATYDLSAFDTRTLVTNAFHNGAAGVTLTQPLLKNFGFGVNAAQIRVARKGFQIAEQNFASRVMDIVRDVNNAYYELVFAIENHKSLLADLNRAKELLEQNRKRVEIGVMSPLDVTQAEAGAAEREEAVIVAEQAIHDNENTLKRLILRDVTEFRGLELLPTDYPVVQVIETDVERSTRTAFENRPDLLAAKHDLERQGILVKFNRNQLLPQMDVSGGYNRAGGSGDGSFNQVLDDIGRGDNAEWNVGVTFSFPIGNRQARANYHIARLNEDTSLINFKKLEQDIIVQIDNAVRLVQSNLKRVDATRAASRLAEESLKAEETKLRAGTSTSFLVLQAQSQLSAAQSAEIRARSDYSESLAALARAEGTILQKNQITLAETKP